MAQNGPTIIQSLVQAMLDEIEILEGCESRMQSIKTKYENLSPSLTRACLTAQQVIDSKAIITGLATFLETTHATTIALLKTKDVPSHDTKALD